MPQGIKKTKVPNFLKKKLEKKGKGSQFTRRAHAPIPMKKSKMTEQDKIKNIITKKVNKKAEDELRALSTAGVLNLSKNQKATVKMNTQKPEPESNSSVKMESDS